jgi:uncharacterized protein YecT (DUF1311 family)
MTLRRCVLGGLLALACGAAGAMDDVEPPIECRPDGTQQEMNACAARDFRAADARLNARYRAALARLSADKAARLRVEQRAWLRQRDAACRKAVKDFEGGSIWPLEYFACREAATETRTRVLERWRPAG